MRVEASGWDQTVVLDDRRVLLGWLSQEALRSHDPATAVAAVMLEGPVTFRPNTAVDEAAAWMDRKAVASILVTSSDGTFLGALRRDDLDADRLTEKRS